MATSRSEVTLLIDKQVFHVNKDVLCEHSDYFRAMFSGNYIEEGKKEITIDVVDAISMNIIIGYMEAGFIDLNVYHLTTIGDLANSANFLQITELIKQIEYCLELNLSPFNWLETMAIAENAAYQKLEEQCAIFGLYQFKLMKPEHVHPIQKMAWYLSHKYLNAESELQVFKFGVNWISHHQTGADTLLLILGCLDMNRLTKEDVSEMITLIKDFENSLAEKVIDCLLKLASEFRITETEMKNNKSTLCETFTKSVYTETLNIISNNSKRELRFKPCLGLWAKEKDLRGELPIAPNYLYMFDKKEGFTKWLEVTDEHLWGWNVIVWGCTKIVIVGGEHGRGTGRFYRNVKVYDVLKKEWAEHVVNLPVRRHAGVGIVEDSLYIVGGVGGYRLILDTVVVYNLKERSWRYINKFPEAIQSPPVCVHEGQVYAGGQKSIYMYDDHNDLDRWIISLETKIRPSCMVSFRGYIYCTQSYFNNFYRYRPGVDKILQSFVMFSGSPSTFCHLGDRLLAFTTANGIQCDMVNVEDVSRNGQPSILWTKKNCIYGINDSAGSCAVIDVKPPLRYKISDYLKRCLANYEACQSNQ